MNFNDIITLSCGILGTGKLEQKTVPKGFMAVWDLTYLIYMRFDHILPKMHRMVDLGLVRKIVDLYFIMYMKKF